jgi:alpha-tubulin suppressor-like RCC1 family protein
MLWSWGQNSHGQLGHGLTASGYLCDAFTPYVVPSFCETLDDDNIGTGQVFSSTTRLMYENTLDRESRPGRVYFISCGATHSLAQCTQGMV